jgi:hypothetical protein
VRLAVLVAVLVEVLVGVLVGVLLGVLVLVDVSVGIAVLLGVLDAVFVAVLVGVLVGMCVAVLVGVLVEVLVGVSVTVFVGVAVRTGIIIGERLEQGTTANVGSAGVAHTRRATADPPASKYSIVTLYCSPPTRLMLPKLGCEPGFTQLSTSSWPFTHRRAPSSVSARKV